LGFSNDSLASGTPGSRTSEWDARESRISSVWDTGELPIPSVRDTAELPILVSWTPWSRFWTVHSFFHLQAIATAYKAFSHLHYFIISNPYVALHQSIGLALSFFLCYSEFFFIKGSLYNLRLKNPA